MFLALVFLICLNWILIRPETFPLFDLYHCHQEEHQKRQWVRLLDILVLGPGAIALAYQLHAIGWNYWAIALAVVGIGTILYNLGNYVLNRVYSR